MLSVSSVRRWQISLPGVTEYTFHKLLCYLYTDEIPPILAEKCLNLLELANRLCLPRLLTLIECRVIEDLTHLAAGHAAAAADAELLAAACTGNTQAQHAAAVAVAGSSCDAVQQCLRLLEPVKLHNAHQLAEWCMSYLCVNYNIICRVSPKSLRALHPDNQEYLREHRWPPVWYLKDYDFYQRSRNDAQRTTAAALARKDSAASAECGCACFTGGKSTLAAAPSWRRWWPLWRWPRRQRRQRRTQQQLTDAAAATVEAVAVS